MDLAAGQFAAGETDARCAETETRREAVVEELEPPFLIEPRNREEEIQENKISRSVSALA